VDPHPGPVTRDRLRQFIPQLEYVELDRCGHEPWRERYARDRFVELVRDWCSRCWRNAPVTGRKNQPQ